MPFCSIRSDNRLRIKHVRNWGRSTYGIQPIRNFLKINSYCNYNHATDKIKYIKKNRRVCCS